MKPKLEELSTFAAIVEAKGLTAAARRLNLAKSVVSKRLADLEAAAGTQLVRRTTRQVQPTEAGIAFYAHAKRILAELDAALEEAACAEGALRGPLRVAAPLSFGRLYLGSIVTEFCRANPEIEFTLDCDDRLIDIQSGGYDLAIRISQLSDSALIARRLAPAPLLLVASPDYLARRGTPQKVADLAEHDCIAYANAPIAHLWSFDSARRGAPAQTVTIRPHLSVNNGEIMRDAAIAGLGLARLPLFMIGDALRDGRLVPVLESRTQFGSAIHALWLPRPGPSRRVRALIDLLAVRVPERLAAAGALTMGDADQ